MPLKFSRLARLILALVPLNLAVMTQSALAQAPTFGRPTLPPGAPPLNPAQQQKFAARNAKFNQDIAALQADRTLTNAQKQAKARQLVQALDKDMLAILTPTQRAAVLKQRSSVTQIREAFLRQHQSEITQAKKLSTALQKSFTPAQKQKIQTIQTQAQAQLQKLQTDTKSSPQVKQQTVAAIIRDTQRQELNVLTPAQRSEFKQSQAIQLRLQQELIAYAKAHGQQ